MKSLLLATAFTLCASTAFALGDTNNSTSANNGSVAVGGNNIGTINNSSGTLGGGSLNNDNRNTNTNINTATGGTAISGSSSTSRSNSNAVSGSLSASDSRSAVNDSGNSANANSATVNQNYQRNPVSTAFAAPLVAADDTCMGSSSAGGQGVGFGLSFGSTWQDGDCVRRKDSRELFNMGERGAAIALMCQNPKIAQAMAAAGRSCPVDVAAEPVRYSRGEGSNARGPVEQGYFRAGY